MCTNRSQAEKLVARKSGYFRSKRDRNICFLFWEFVVAWSRVLSIKKKTRQKKSRWEKWIFYFWNLWINQRIVYPSIDCLVLSSYGWWGFGPDLLSVFIHEKSKEVFRTKKVSRWEWSALKFIRLSSAHSRVHKRLGRDRSCFASCQTSTAFVICCSAIHDRECRLKPTVSIGEIISVALVNSLRRVARYRFWGICFRKLQSKRLLGDIYQSNK